MSIDGTPWTDVENEQVVEAYFELLRLDVIRASMGGPAVPKMVVYRKIETRNHKSVERKMQNISAILELLGLPWVSGLKPQANYQRNLVGFVEKHLGRGLALPLIEADPLKEVIVVPPPPLVERPNRPIPDHMQQLIGRYDPADKDERNRELGKLGEKLVFDLEMRRLQQFMPKRLSDLRWVARDEGDGHGFDIRSFDEKGEERLIEVKTTRGRATTPFYMSRNEKEVSERTGEAYRIFRVFEYGREPKIFLLKPPLEQVVKLTPQTYSASFS